MVTQDGDNVIIDWEGGSLALYVATPDATLPLGPGAVQGGETFWAVSATAFPTTFEGPVTYGVVPEGGSDVSETNGAPVGGTPLESGKCYRFSVVVDFAYSHTLRFFGHKGLRLGWEGSTLPPQFPAFFPLSCLKTWSLFMRLGYLNCLHCRPS